MDIPCLQTILQNALTNKEVQHENHSHVPDSRLQSCCPFMAIDQSRSPLIASNAASVNLLSITLTLPGDLNVFSVYLIFETKLILLWTCSEAAVHKCFSKLMLLKVPQYSHDCNFRPATLGLQPFRPATLLKRDSKTCVFLWILLKSWEHLYWKTSAKGCCCP